MVAVVTEHIAPVTRVSKESTTMVISDYPTTISSTDTPELFAPSKSGAVTLVLDVTASMNETIEALQKFLMQYIIRRCMTQTDPPIERLSLVTFHDHYTSYVKAVSENAVKADGSILQSPIIWGTTDNLEEYAYWLNRCGDDEFRSTGGDPDEAIACAIAAARQLDPEASIWLITDAKPHYYISYLEDHSTGTSYKCICGIDLDDLDLTRVSVLLIGYIEEYFYSNFGIPVVCVDTHSDDLERILSETYND